MGMQCCIAHFAMIRNPLINGKGMHTSALFGFVNQIMKLINNEKPDLMVPLLILSKLFVMKDIPIQSNKKKCLKMIEQLPFFGIF